MIFKCRIYFAFKKEEMINCPNAVRHAFETEGNIVRLR